MKRSLLWRLEEFSVSMWFHCGRAIWRVYIGTDRTSAFVLDPCPSFLVGGMEAYAA